jgi:hypothetical protein
MEGYDVVRQLGKGGMGTAFCVRHDNHAGLLCGQCLRKREVSVSVSVSVSI